MDKADGMSGAAFRPLSLEQYDEVMSGVY